MRLRGPSHGAWRGDGQAPFDDAYRRLSVRVIDQALRDIVAASGSTSDGRSARVFLAGSPMLDLWCQVAALDPARVVAHAGQLVDGRSAFGRRAPRVGGSVRAEPVKSTI